MSPIPGIDDYDDDEDVSPPPAYRKKRGLDVDQGCGREKRICTDIDVDEEDEELYGRSSGDSKIQNEVKSMTLTTEKLPVTESEFVHRLLSVDSFPPAEVSRGIWDMPVTGSCIQTGVCFKEAFIPAFYPYFKTKADGLMHVTCFCFATPDKAIRAKFGYLVSVEIIPIDDTISPCRTFAYVAESSRRLPDKSLRLESELMSHLYLTRDQTVVHELVLLLPFCEHLYHYSHFHVNVAPLCSVGHLLMQWRAVYSIGSNPLFRYIQNKDFSLSPTGILIAAENHSFSSQQLESIQRAVDVVMQPVFEYGNPCKAVFIDGDPCLVRPAITQILTELLSLTRLQFIVTSSAPSLELMVKKLMHQKILPAKAIYFAGGDEVRVREYAKDYVKKEMEKLKTSDANETDGEKKKQIEAHIRHLNQCLSVMCDDGHSTRTVTSSVQDTIDEFTHRALQYSLRSARLIFGTLSDFSRSQVVYEHLRSPKVDASIEQTSVDEKKKYPISTCMIADADSMTDPQLMAFANEFSITRFILSSSWFPADELPVNKSEERPPVQLVHSFSQRLRQSAGIASNSLIVEIPAME